ncbi:DUF7543 family protein [Natronocalculus amylovorans]|uniref:Uncharacterized protein n=1 Tax=Natronocalculus amylovorans TaxID=2917812 RepID=A0AAE3FYA2_9EURY|nr:hypothetical protein [Natronocalculus amylovorans]MCL9817597.1 hypothetical protein [Natronocalculus amylovorans]
MSWDHTMATETIDEWARSDGYVTIRKRKRTDGKFVLRLDKLEQAPGGRSYEQTIASDEEAADRICQSWQTKYKQE